MNGMQHMVTGRHAHRSTLRALISEARPTFDACARPEAGYQPTNDIEQVWFRPGAAS
jgi:hypothetical protein